MKQVYLLALSFVTSLATMANAPQFVRANASVNDFDPEVSQVLRQLGVNPKNVVKVADLPNSDQFKADVANGMAMKKSPAKEESITWKSLGDGSRMINPLLFLLDEPTEVIDVDMSVSEGLDDDIYRVVNPLKNSANLSNGYVETSDNYSFLMNTVGGDQVYISPTPIYKFAGEYASYGEVYLFNLAGYYKAYSPENLSDAMYGTLKRGVISFDAGTVYLYIKGSIYTIPEDMKIASPGKKLYYTSLYVQNSCVDDNGVVAATVYFAGDVQTAKVGLSVGYIEPSNSWYSAIASESGVEVATQSGQTFYFKLSGYSLGEGLDINEHCPFTVIAAGLDSNGSAGSGSTAQLYYQPEEEGLWKSIGKGKFTDGFISDYFDTTAASVEVEIEESTDLAGFYRVVNPFASLYSQYLDTTDHNHYLYVSMVDGEPIYIPYSSTGIDLGYGVATVASASYYNYYMGEDISDDIAAIWDDETKTLTFPQYALIMGQPMYEYGIFEGANYSGTFALQFPEGYSNGVKDITTDDANAPVQYFNLQGMRIANPTAGQMVIRRQGATVTKQLVR